MSKKPSSIVIPKNILLTGSPLSSPIKSDEAFEKELDRSKREFNQFNQDLDEIARSMEKLYKDAPEWFSNVQELKKRQDNVEEYIMATQDKIMENEIRFAKLKTCQDEIHEDINNDLKKIQDQINELLEKHRVARLNVSNICYNQSKTSEQLDLMLQAIHEYARLIEEASSTIKNHSDNGKLVCELYEKYETLDLSPFRKHETSKSYFESLYRDDDYGDDGDDDGEYYHRHQYYEHEEIITTTTNIIGSEESSPLTESPQASSVTSTTTHTSATTPTSIGVNSPSLNSPINSSTATNTSQLQSERYGTGVDDGEENEDQKTEQQQQPIHPLPHYQLKHQKLLLLSMRRAAVGLKFLLYANQLNDYKNGCPDGDCDLDLDIDDDPTITREVTTTTTYREVVHDEDTTVNSNNNTSVNENNNNKRNNSNVRCGIGCLNKSISNNSSSSSSCTSSDSGSDSNNSDSGSNNDDNNNKDIGKICVTIRKRSLVVHSYDLLRFDKKMLVKQKN